MSRTFAAIVAALILALILGGGAARATTPHWHRVTPDDGLLTAEVLDVAQSTDGFVWAATRTGVARVDGRRAEPADGGRIRDMVLQVVALEDGRVVARTAHGVLWWVDGERTREVDLPGGDRRVRDIARDGRGRLLAVARGEVWRREFGGWAPLPVDPALGPILVVEAAPHDALVVGTRTGWHLWTVEGWRTLAPVEGWPLRAVLADDGAWWLLDTLLRVRRVGPDGHVEELLRNGMRGMGLVVRDGVAWATSGASLFRIEPDGEVVVHDQGRFGVSSGGALFLDQEGSLWLGTYRGLGRLAEPEAVRYGIEDGMPSAAVRSVNAGSGRLWMGSWQGALVLDPENDRVHHVAEPLAKAHVCVDDTGIGWTVTVALQGHHRVVALDEDGLPVGMWPVPAWTNFWSDCVRTPDGHVLLAAGPSLFRVRGVGPPDPVVDLPFGPQTMRSYRGLGVTSGPTLWLASGSEVCHAPLDAVLAGAPPWRCDSIPGAGIVNGIHETGRGSIWVATQYAGLQQWTEDGFERHPLSDALPNSTVRGLAPSPRGGTWVLSHGVSRRVLDRPEAPFGVETREELSAWLAELVVSPTDVHEAEDGTLFFTASSGVTRVPPEARQPPSEPPTVRAVELRVDGVDVEGPSLVFPASESRVTLRFAASSHRALRLLRYRMRVDDGAWSEPSREARYDLFGLAPGAHRVQVQATLDGRRWSAPPAEVRIQVPRPWLGRIELWLLALALGVGGVAAVARVRTLLRLRTERLRTRIAMDLHDEVGAGLASIELLGGLLEGGLPEESRRDVAGRVRATADELGQAMRAIVWSLEPSSLRLGALGAFLEERARDLLPSHDVHVERPALDHAGPLGLDVLRSVQLIALEALHNVHRHARADRVDVRLVAERRGWWRLEVCDDGVGLSASPPTPGSISGNGLRSMRARAEAIGARLDVLAVDGGGTRVCLRFPVTARPTGRTP